MTSPSETASPDQVVPEDDQSIPELERQSPAPTGSGYPGVTAAGSTADEPGAAGTADAEAPFAFVTVAGSTADEPGAADSTADAEAPFAFSTTPVTEPEPAPAVPLAANGANLSTRWPEIQAMFVDDPRASVQLAAGLVDDSVDALMVSLKKQQHSLLHAWQGDDPGTEELRTTVQRYRTFWKRLEDFSREA
jgi:hypothetical protein